jgi:hypothetical protein
MSQFDNFFNEVFDKFSKDITDRIFLMIENDPELMDKYSSLVGNDKKVKDELNSELGKEIRKKYDLENLKKNKNPESSLIKSYREHK